MALNYFYHPLGSYAEHMTPGVDPQNRCPHTYNNHGFSKVDFGVGPGHTVYSMTNGEVVTITNRHESDQLGFVIVVKTNETGYSKMVASERGGAPSDYPLYYSYLEMEYLKEPFASLYGVTENTSYINAPARKTVQPNIQITKGQEMGITNSFYGDFSNLHMDIGFWDRYTSTGGENANPNDRRNWNIRMGLQDNFLLQDIDVKKYLAEGFSLTPDEQNIIAPDGTILGVPVNGIYYPPATWGGVISTMNGEDNRVRKFYHYSTMFQKPTYLQGTSVGMTESYDPQVDVGVQDEREMKMAGGVIIWEVGSEGPFGDHPNYYAYMEMVCRCVRNRVAAGHNIWSTTRTWNPAGGDFDGAKMLNVFNSASQKLQDFIFSVLRGNNYFLIEQVINYAATEYGDSRHLYCVTNFNSGESQAKLIGTFEGTNGRVNAIYNLNLIEDGIIEV